MPDNNPTTNYASQFEQTFHLLAQTQGARLSQFMREKEYTNAEDVFYDQMAAVSEEDRDTRYGRTNYRDIKTDRRRLAVSDKVIALQIDKPDENRTLADIRNPQINQVANAWKRSKDIAGIEGALGITFSGKNGTTANPFDWTNQKVAVDVGDTASTGMNVDKLRAAKALFWGNDIDIDNPMYKLHIAVTGGQLDDLLGSLQVTSSDYNSVKTLVNGDVDSFMGFTFHRSELLPFMNSAGDNANLDWIEDTTYGYRKADDVDSTDVRACFAWAEDMVCVGTNKSYKLRAEELQEYNYNFGIFAEWGIGSMRQEEKGVVALPCDQSPA